MSIKIPPYKAVQTYPGELTLFTLNFLLIMNMVLETEIGTLTMKSYFKRPLCSNHLASCTDCIFAFFTSKGGWPKEKKYNKKPVSAIS